MKGQKLYSRRDFNYLVVSVRWLGVAGMAQCPAFGVTLSYFTVLEFYGATCSRRPEASRSSLSRTTISIRRRCVAPKTPTGWQECFGASEERWIKERVAPNQQA